MTRRSATQVLALALCVQLILPTTALGIATDGSTLIGERGATGVNSTGETAPTSDPFAGTATYTIPILVPAGAGGLQPTLALRYASSNRSASWVGYGWSLEASAIRRSLKEGVPAHDDAVDAFELDGTLLVPDATATGRFHTRRESFSRIEQIGTSWEIRSKDGAISRYGIDANSTITNTNPAASPPNPTFAWLLAEREDPHGNIIHYLYDDTDPGQRYLKEIRYTLRRPGGPGSPLQSLNESAAPQNAVDRVIRFTLEDDPLTPEADLRPDPTLSHAAGFLQEMNRRLQYIDVVAGDALVRRYELFYGVQSPDSQTSLLREVRDHGSDALSGTATPPRVHAFTYQSNVALQNGWELATNWSLPNGIDFVRDGQDNGVRFAELNGDGRIDVIREVRTNTAPENDADSGAWLNTASGFSPDPGYRLPMSANHSHRMAFVQRNTNPEPDRWESQGIVLTDFTRDGRADALRLYNGYRIVAPPLDPFDACIDHEYRVRTDAGWDVRFASFNPEGTLITDPDLDMIGDSSVGFTFAVGGYPDAAADAHTTSGMSQTADLNGDGRLDLLTRGLELIVPPTCGPGDPGYPVCEVGAYWNNVVVNLGDAGFDLPQYYESYW